MIITRRRFSLLLVAAFFAAGVSRADAPKTPQETRAAFLKIIDRPRVELDAKEQSEPSGDLSLTKFSFASEASQRVPGILLKRPGENGRRPAVIVMHGTGGTKDREMPWLKALVANGFIAVAIDGRYHGERGNQTEYNAAIARAFEKGGEHPLYYDTVWDVMRLIDYLQTRPDIDGKRIGVVGTSKGGIETYFASAVDERIAVSVPCIGVQSFRWALEHNAWRGRVGTISKAFAAAAKLDGVDKPDAAFVRHFYDRVVPGIDTEFDGPVMLPLIAPRPLLMINGDSDDKTPLEGVKICAAAARQAYEAAGAEEKFKQIVEPKTGHNVLPTSREEAVAWFVRWLAP